MRTPDVRYVIVLYREFFMELMIYGAQAIALGAYKALKKLYPVRPVTSFLVSGLKDNAPVLDGLPVREVGEFAGTLTEEDKKNTEILIATPENVMREIENTLEDYGFKCHVRLTSLRWMELMRCYYAAGGEYVPLAALPVGFHKPDIYMFMAKFYRDKPVKSDYPVPEWMTPIQVGAALCGERVASVLDCMGDNISAKNVNYSELTALYWIWKNRLVQEAAGEREEYYGLSHYRRIPELSADDILRLADNDVDVVLPYPMPYEPDIEEHHRRYLAEADWNALRLALAELQPEYAEAFPGILKQQYFYNYNIILAKKAVLGAYCEWLFPILERVEELSVPRGSERQDRYIGYMGETLETLYFMHNRDRLNIVHTGCRFLT